MSFAALPSTTIAAPIDFTAFTVERYPRTNGFPDMGPWNLTSTTAAQVTNNASASVLYGPDDMLNTRITGKLNPGGDDDIIGFVLGFNPGDTNNTSADYLLLDWKGVTQSFDFADFSGGPFHDLTGSTTRNAGLLFSRVSGTPTADELWSHQDLPQNTSGGVMQLGTAATLASTGYPTNTDVVFDINYTASRVVIAVDGVVQFDVVGTFGSGRFGLYSGWMGNPTTLPVFTDFQTGNPDETLQAVVNRTTGEVKLRNNSDSAIEFNSYELDSDDGSLDADGWYSLDEQDYDAIGGGLGQSWDESGGSNASTLMELYLLGSSTLDAQESISLGRAYDVAVDAQDVTLTFRFVPLDSPSVGVVTYITSPLGDLDGDGALTDADVSAFILALTNRAAFEANHPWVDPDELGDFDDNGQLDFGDIAGFQAAIASLGPSTGSATSVPEPSAFLLAACAVGCLTRCRRCAF